MVGWNHWLNGQEFEQTLGDGDGQGSLVCYSPWGHKESDMTEQMNKIQNPADDCQTGRLSEDSTENSFHPRGMKDEFRYKKDQL